jgi:hypothetical protein
MIYKGKLQCIKYKDGVHYGMFCHGNYFDFTDNFNCQLMDKIKFSVGNGNNFFRQTGRLKRTKDLNGKYVYKINNKNIDNVLEKFCGQIVEVEMKNMEEI